jgi:hypothetical protein
VAGQRKSIKGSNRNNFEVRDLDFLENNVNLKVVPRYTEKGIEYDNQGINTCVSSYKDTVGHLSYDDIAFLMSPLQKITYVAFAKTKKLLHVNKYTLNSYKNKMTVYEVALKNNMPYKKLLYTLKRIKFTMIKKPSGRIGYLIDEEKFKITLGLILIQWKLQENKKGWIKLLRGSGFSKSYASNFMTRKIKEKIVPTYYFLIVKPEKLYLDHILNCKKNSVSLPENIWHTAKNKSNS